MTCTATTINLIITPRGEYRPGWDTLKVTLPEGEQRALLINGETGEQWKLS